MRKKVLRGVVFILCLITSGLVLFAFLRPDSSKQERPNPIPLALQKYSKPYDLYYPDYTPVGYTFNPNTVQQLEDTLQFGLMNNRNSEGYYFSQQALPRQSVTVNFHSKVLVGPTVADCPVGTALIGLIDDKLVASIVNESTWTIITAPVGTIKSELETIVSSLKPL